MDKKKKMNKKKEKKGNPDGFAKVTLSIIETIKTYPETFSWTPSLSIDPIGKEELIEELKNGGKIGKLFIERVVHGTVRRMMREANKK